MKLFRFWNREKVVEKLPVKVIDIAEWKRKYEDSPEELGKLGRSEGAA